MKSQVLILDYGSQFTQLIARTIRELGVYCEILPGTAAAADVLKRQPKCLILSGGPASVNTPGAPLADIQLLTAGLPILGICYGMQILGKLLGGRVEGWERDATTCEVNAKEAMREFGPAFARFDNPIGPFSFLVKGSESKVWMSHGDKVTVLPSGFVAVASSAGSPIAAFGHTEKKIYGVQFHPEVHHTPIGKELLRSFLFDLVAVARDWNPSSFATEVVASIRRQVPDGNVVCGLSGGVDSTVAAVLVHQAIGERLYCIFVDNGLLRLNEAAEVMESMEKLGLNVKLVDAAERFLRELKDVTDPEQKRKIIGRVFIEVFEEEAQKVAQAKYLVQGTLYPDVIESVSVIGNSVTIKSHHNVGGLIANMKLKLIEPLRELFKDEVRAIGRSLGIDHRLIDRQPFPGPGLGVRCLGEITPEKLEPLRRADRIVREEVEAAGLNREIWQAFAVLLPVSSVGVMGDGRTYEQTIAIRAVTSRDGMTADWYLFPEELLRRMSARIINETKGINRVVLDISSKPPATIEWE